MTQLEKKEKTKIYMDRLRKARRDADFCIRWGVPSGTIPSSLGSIYGFMTRGKYKSPIRYY